MHLLRVEFIVIYTNNISIFKYESYYKIEIFVFNYFTQIIKHLKTMLSKSKSEISFKELQNKLNTIIDIESGFKHFYDNNYNLLPIERIEIPQANLVILEADNVFIENSNLESNSETCLEDSHTRQVFASVLVCIIILCSFLTN